MKIVFDTNVLIAAFISHGASAELMEHAALHHEMIVSEYILDEFRHTLLRKFHVSSTDALEAYRLVQSRCLIVDPAPIPRGDCRDPKDLPILGTAVSGSCDCLVTGDQDLLILKRYRGIDIVIPIGFWQYEADR